MPQQPPLLSVSFSPIFLIISCADPAQIFFFAHVSPCFAARISSVRIHDYGRIHGEHDFVGAPVPAVVGQLVAAVVGVGPDRPMALVPLE